MSFMKRAIDLSHATDLDKAAIALYAIGTAAGLGLVVAAAFALRKRNNVGVVACLLAASLCYLIANTLNLAVTLEQNNTDLITGEPLRLIQKIYNISSAAGFFTAWLGFFVYVAGFMLLWHAAGPRYHKIHRIVEWFFLVQIFVWLTVNQGFAAAARNAILQPELIFSGQIQYLDDMTNVFAYLNTAVYGVVTVDFVIMVVWTFVAQRSGGGARRILTVLALVFMPLLVLNYLAGLITTIYFQVTAQTPTLSTQLAIAELNFSSVVIFVVLYPGMISSLLYAARERVSQTKDAEVPIQLRTLSEETGPDGDSLRSSSKARP